MCRLISNETTTNELGQSITTYKKSNEFMCDIQPSTSQIVKKTFGKDIESIYTMFADEDLEEGSYVLFNAKTYVINSKIDWIDYKIYSLTGCDINVI